MYVKLHIFLQSTYCVLDVMCRRGLELLEVEVWGEADLR